MIPLAERETEESDYIFFPIYISKLVYHNNPSVNGYIKKTGITESTV